MNWVHHVIYGLTACCFSVVAFTIWRSLAQEMKLGKVDNLRWQAARLFGVSLSVLTSSWEAVASPKSGSDADYVRWGMQILAIAAIVYGIRGRRPAGSR